MQIEFLKYKKPLGQLSLQTSVTFDFSKTQKRLDFSAKIHLGGSVEGIQQPMGATFDLTRVLRAIFIFEPAFGSTTSVSLQQSSHKLQSQNEYHRKQRRCRRREGEGEQREGCVRREGGN